MTDAEMEARMSHRFGSTCELFREEAMKRVTCKSCGLPLDSEVDEEEALAEERSIDPEVTEVEFYCQVCLALKMAEHPDAPMLGAD
jgi:RNase P subunit RPR2